MSATDARAGPPPLLSAAAVARVWGLGFRVQNVGFMHFCLFAGNAGFRIQAANRSPGRT